MGFLVNSWVVGCLVVFSFYGDGMFTKGQESTTLSLIERKTCGNTTREYCPNTGCCIDRDRLESCCHFMQVSEWCPLHNGSDVFCDYGCCYHTENEICCTFFTMKYSFLIIVAAIFVSFFIAVIVISCLSQCLSKCYNCSCTEPSYTRAY